MDHQNPRPQVKVVNATVNVVNGIYIRKTTRNQPNTISHSQNVEGVTVNASEAQYAQWAAEAGHYNPYNGHNQAMNTAIQRAGPDVRIYNHTHFNGHSTTHSTAVIAQSDIAPMSDATAQAHEWLFDEAFADSAWPQAKGPPSGVRCSTSQGGYRPSADFGMHTMLGMATQMATQMSTSFNAPGTTTSQTTHASSAYSAHSHSKSVPRSGNR